MIDAQQWLDHAIELAAPPVTGAPRQVKVRRSISASYYALFHHFLKNACDELIGAVNAGSATYALAYRAFEHGPMRQRCEVAQASTLSDKLKDALGIQSFSTEIREAALAFTSLQKKRHRADYDPRGRVRLSEAIDAYQTCIQGMAALATADGPERKLFLLYLLFGAR